MEFFKKIEKKSENYEINNSHLGFKKGEKVKIFRPKDYNGPEQNIFYYKGYVCEIYQNDKYNDEYIFVKIMSKSNIQLLKINKYFLKRI